MAGGSGGADGRRGRFAGTGERDDLRRAQAVSERRKLRKGSRMRILLVWILNAVALWLVAVVLPGVTVADEISALVAAIVLGLVNAVIKPVLIILTLPVTLLTLGLFLLVLNGLLFWGVASILPGFNVDGFWWGVAGALIYSVLTWAFSTLLPQEQRR